MSLSYVELQDLCSPKQHKTIATKNLSEVGYPVFGANGQIGFHSAYTHEKATIAITCRGATCGTVNVTPEKCYINGNAMALDNLDGSKVDLHFLKYFLIRRGFHDVISGSAQPQITRAPLLTLLIPLPPLPEQKRIAAILDQADALRQKRQQALDHLNQLGQSIFYEMFLDGGSYEKKALIDCVEDVQIGPFGSLLHQADYIENGIPLINPKHINGGKVEPQTKVSVTEKKYVELKRYHMRSGDVVMARRGEMGRCAVIDEQSEGYLCGTGSLFIRSNLKLLRPFYLQRFLSSHRTIRILENEASGSDHVKLERKGFEGTTNTNPANRKTN